MSLTDAYKLRSTNGPSSFRAGAKTSFALAVVGAVCAMLATTSLSAVAAVKSASTPATRSSASTTVKPDFAYFKK